jgi:biopolymer transport protein ExbD
MASLDGPLTAPRTGRYRISLTPLADAMFQLLLFFMLSSNITPYSLLTLKGAAGVPDAPGGDGPGPPPGALADAAVVTIRQGDMILGGVTFPMADAARALGTLTLGEARGVVLVLDPAAQVQDLTTVLEQLAFLQIRDVQIAQSPTQSPAGAP